MTFGSIHYNVNAEGVLRLLGPHTSRSTREQLPTSPRTSSISDLKVLWLKLTGAP